LFNKYAKNLASNTLDLATNHDFLAQIPLSPNQNSDCNVSDLSSSFWSARISQKLNFEVSHERHKLLIPVLDLTNLPPDSDDENNVDPKGTQEEKPHYNSDALL